MSTTNYFQSFFENNLYGILELNDKGHVIKANGVIENFLSRSIKDIQGRAVTDLLHPDDGVEFSKKHNQLSSGKSENYELEARFRKKSGKMLHTSVAVTPVIEKEKKGKNAIAIVRDISRQKSNERKIQKNEEMFRLVSESTRDLICLLDAKGKYIYLSPSVEDILGFTPEELIGTSPYLLFHPQDVTGIMKESQYREQEKELRYTLEYRMRKKDDSYIWLQTITEPIKNDKGETVKIQTSSRDITAMKKAEENVNNLLNETQLLNDRLKKNSEMLERNLDETLVLNNELEEREKLKNLLISISNALAGLRDKEELFNIILNELQPIVGFDAAGITHLNLAESSQKGFIFISEKIKAITKLNGRVFPIKDEISTKILSSNNPMVVNLLQLTVNDKHTEFSKELLDMGMKEILAVKMKHFGNDIGILYLGSREVRRFEHNQFDLVGGVAGQLGAALNNIIAFEQEEVLRHNLEREVLYLNEEISTNFNFKEIIGESNSLKDVMSRMSQVAATDTTVLINGETGTGKELIARGIHNLSSRNGRPLIKVNCAALPAQLIESELFGHEKGSFTGATDRRLGKFELATGSTIFLDEIGELPLNLQSKLLRVLQEKELERIGGKKTIKVDTRIITATNRNLEDEVAAGTFRSDLYYRLHVFPLTLPALRERKEDIPLLAAHFIKKLEKKLGKRIEGLSPSSYKAMNNYSWPGNIRELEHILERTAISAHTSILDVELPIGNVEFTSQNGDSMTSLIGLDEMESRHIVGVLRYTNGRIRGEGGAAEILKIKPTTLEARMKKLGIVKTHVLSN